MYCLFEISVISIVQADFGVDVGTVVTACVKFVGFPIWPEEFSSFRICFIFLIKNRGLPNALTLRDSSVTAFLCRRPKVSLLFKL